MRAALLLAGALLCGAGAAPLPRPAPRLYVTGNYGVRMVVPAGLFYCPLPDNWVGTDHGRFLFLVKPRDCDADEGPRILLDYEHNVAEHDYGGAEERAARTDGELRRAECGADSVPVLGLRLLRRAITGCRVRQDASVEVTARAVYSLGGESDPEPGYTLLVGLYTTPGRLAADSLVFRRVLAGISVCTPGWAHRAAGRAACREHPGSWW